MGLAWMLPAFGFIFNAGSIILDDFVGDAVGFLFLRAFLSR
jgi:hypothetical protein